MVTVYGKPGCGKCEAAKDKLNRMGVAFTAANLADKILPHDGWREDGTVAVMACYTATNTMPVLLIGEDAYTYSGAMRLLKNRKKEESRMDTLAVA